MSLRSLIFNKQFTSSFTGKGCLLSPKGHYVPSPGSSSFKECPVGTYQDKEGQSDCKGKRILNITLKVREVTKLQLY